MTEREKDLIISEKRWAREKDLLEREYKLVQEQKDLKNKYKKKMSTSKWLIFFLFLNCTIIELFTGYVTLQTLTIAKITGLPPDLTPLVTLIGIVVAEVIGFAVYALKSLKENTSGGIIYETAMANLISEAKG